MDDCWLPAEDWAVPDSARAGCSAEIALAEAAPADYSAAPRDDHSAPVVQTGDCSPVVDCLEPDDWAESEWLPAAHSQPAELPDGSLVGWQVRSPVDSQAAPWLVSPAFPEELVSPEVAQWEYSQDANVPSPAVQWAAPDGPPSPAAGLRRIPAEVAESPWPLPRDSPRQPEALPRGSPYWHELPIHCWKLVRQRLWHSPEPRQSPWH